ncbi:MAG: sn-glycerol-3-phosphate ABC transporter ATP-binding protein UgpC [Rhizobiaceae bacterium]
MVAVGLERVSKSFGPVDVIHDVSFGIEEGEFVVMVGPSGCGKSTLLRMVAGLEHISRGGISIGGRIVNGLEPKDRDIAMVFQNYALYPHMNVFDNMSFSLRLAGVAKPEIRTRVERAADILGLRPLLERYPRQLSGGQRQRVAMGRAIVRDPKVFLFDEPLSNLDAKLRVAMRAEIMGLHQRLRTTTIYVTHDQVEAMTMADRIVVLQGGRIEQIGAPLELYDRPDSLFVAGFIGSPSMNLLDGRIVDAGGRRVFRTDGGRVLPLPPRADLPGNDVPLVYGIRPEHFRLGADAPEAIEVEVRLTEMTGAETQIQAGFGQDRLVAVFRDRLGAAAGSTLAMAPDLDRVHLFDRASGLRV